MSNEARLVAALRRAACPGPDPTDPIDLSNARLVAALRKAACPGPVYRSDPIDLNNACRAFYQARLQSARALRERWEPSQSRVSGHAGETTALERGDDGERDTSDKNDNSRKKSSIDVAMATLHQEMTSLMEQDLSLMKQLLTLNEEIEELKWRRRYCWSRTSMASSGDVDSSSLASFTSSDASLGWWRESGDLPPKYPGISSLSLHAGDHNRLSVCDEEDFSGTFNRYAARRHGSLRTLPVTGQGHPQHKHLLDVHDHQRHHESLRHHDTQQNLHQPLRHHDTQQNLLESLRHNDTQHHHEHQRHHEPLRHHQHQQNLHESLRHQAISDKQKQRVGAEERVKKDFADPESFDSGIHEGYSDASLTLAHTNSITEMTHL
ncbi:uncharacterized protein [Littorina saxatilis]|uniref:Uncharacterized protein n=1 Tax=Littorina saxatilis TaxID=31220 RepID=A0AAN9B9I3_9CAEN